MIKVVLFDLDNTLIDFMKMKKMSASAALSAMIDSGLNMDYGKAEKILFKLYDKHGIEYQHIFQEFLKKTSGKVDYKVLSNAITAYRRVQMGFLSPYPHVRSTLIKLREKGIKLGIVSDAPKLKAWLRLSEMNLTEFFDIVVTFDDTGKKKPHHLPYKAALRKFRVKPEEVLFVGDWPERDIKGAQKAGMKTALAEYGTLFPKGKIKPDFELKEFRQLLELV